MPVNRRHLLALLSVTLTVAAAASLLIHFVWHGESWANRTEWVLIALCLVLMALLYRLGGPGFAPFRRLSPRWRRVVIGILIILSAFPWSLLVALGIRYQVVPNNLTTGLVLLIPVAAFIIIGLYIVIQGSIGRA